MDYERFIKLLDLVNEKIYHSLLNGGRHAFLIGDVRKKGKYYSIIRDITWFGDLESHIIKVQHNTVSGRKQYSNNNFMRIGHEHLLVFRKNDIRCVNIKITQQSKIDIRKLNNITWTDLVKAVIEHFGGQTDLQSIYNTLEGCKKSENNSHMREKVRQVVQNKIKFRRIKQGIYAVA